MISVTEESLFASSTRKFLVPLIDQSLLQDWEAVFDFYLGSFWTDSQTEFVSNIFQNQSAMTGHASSEITNSLNHGSKTVETASSEMSEVSNHIPAIENTSSVVTDVSNHVHAIQSTSSTNEKISNQILLNEFTSSEILEISSETANSQLAGSTTQNCSSESENLKIVASKLILALGYRKIAQKLFTKESISTNSENVLSEQQVAGEPNNHSQLPTSKLECVLSSDTNNKLNENDKPSLKAGGDLDEFKLCLKGRLILDVVMRLDSILQTNKFCCIVGTQESLKFPVWMVSTVHVWLYIPSLCLAFFFLSF